MPLPHGGQGTILYANFPFLGICNRKMSSIIHNRFSVCLFAAIWLQSDGELWNYYEDESDGYIIILLGPCSCGSAAA